MRVEGTGASANPTAIQTLWDANKEGERQYAVPGERNPRGLGSRPRLAFVALVRRQKELFTTKCLIYARNGALEGIFSDYHGAWDYSPPVLPLIVHANFFCSWYTNTLYCGNCVLLIFLCFVKTLNKNKILKQKTKNLAAHQRRSNSV